LALARFFLSTVELFRDIATRLRLIPCWPGCQRPLLIVLSVCWMQQLVVQWNTQVRPPL